MTTLLHDLVHGPSEAVAVDTGTARTDYRGLHALANAVARRVGGASGPVGVRIADPHLLVPTIIGVLKSGRPYLPLEPSWPDARCARIAEAVSMDVLVSDQPVGAALTRACVSVRVQELAEGGHAPEPEPVGAPSPLAYLVLTSGSTGTPKAVAVDHAAAVGSARARRALYGESVGRFLWHSPAAFDSSVAGLFWTLMDGGTLVCPDAATRVSPRRLAERIRDGRVSHLLCLPRVWREVLHTVEPGELDDLRSVIVAGEEVPAALPGEHHATTRADLWNEYGPAEASVWATAHKLDAPGPPDRAPAIGTPRPGVELYLLREDLSHATPGETGTIWLAGEALARGYHGAPGATADRFVPDPHRPGRRAYRTGDLATRREDGALVYRGREDDQVKISGIRIEPAEVERVLQRVPGVRDCAVVARSVDSRASLTAFVILVSGAGTDEVEAALRELLPVQFVPSRLVAVDHLPRNSNGKIDRRALAAGEESETAPVGPPGEGEEPEHLAAVLTAWRSALRTEDVKPRSDLFELGGDSITAVVISTNLAEHGLAASPQDVFRARTPIDLAGRVEATGREAAENERPEPHASMEDRGEVAPVDLPLTPIQRWFFAEHPTDHWNLSVALRIEGDLDRVRARLTEVLERHPLLSAVFPVVEDRSARLLRPGVGAIAVTIEECDGPLPDLRDEEAERLQRTLDLENGPVCHLHWSQGTDDRAHALIVTHHVVVDAVSWRTIMGEVTRLLRGGELEPLDITPLVRAHLSQSDPDEAERRFWRDQAQAAAAPLTGLRPGTESQATTTRRVIGGIDAVRFRARAEQRPDAGEDVMLAALLLACGRVFDLPPRLGVEVETHGREPGFADVVGWFTRFHPLALRHVDPMTAREALAEVRRSREQVSRYGSGYLGSVHSEGVLAPDTAPAAPFSLNYLGRVADSLRVDGRTIEVDPDPFGQRSGATPRRNTVQVSAYLSGDELIVDLRHPRKASTRCTTLADALHEAITPCLEVDHVPAR